MATGADRETRAVPPLGAVAAGFYSDLRLPPVLRGLLHETGLLLDARGGSVSLVEPGGERYAKAAGLGTACSPGETFPLDEGVTGMVVEGRGPVVLRRYGDIATGHLPPDHPAQRAAVAAVPIWWRGEVIGANIVFAPEGRRLGAAEVDELEVLTSVAAAAIVKSGAGDPSLAHLIRTHPRADPALAGVSTVVTEVGPVRPVAPAVAGVALDLVGAAEREAARRAPEARLHVAVVHRPDGLRLLVQDADVGPGGLGLEAPDPLGQGAHSWQELAAAAGGGLTVERVPGWGTLVCADLPYEAPAPPPPPAEPSPLTPREAEVLALLADGLTDRDIAARLVISVKTAEKHVGAVLRKTGTTSRTGAVAAALRRGWTG